MRTRQLFPIGERVMAKAKGKGKKTPPKPPAGNKGGKGKGGKGKGGKGKGGGGGG